MTLRLTHVVDDELELRLLGPWDAPQLYVVIDANREHLSQWCGWVERHQDATEARREVAQAMRERADGTGSDAGVYAHGELVGWVGLNEIDHARGEANLWYWLAHAAQSQGIATRVLRAMVHHGFGDLGLRRIRVECDAVNERSRALLDRLGFVHEATMCEYDALVHRTWRDTCLYGLLREDLGEGEMLPLRFAHRIDDDIELRFPEPRDAEMLWRVIEANHHHLTYWLCGPAEQSSDDDVREMLRTELRACADGRGLNLAVHEQGEPVGMVAFDGISPESATAEMSYWLAEHTQGRGTMTRACKVMLAHAFTTLGLKRVSLYSASANHRSCALAQRLGFHEEGTLRQAAVHPDGTRGDAKLYAMLATDWPEQSKP